LRDTPTTLSEEIRIAIGMKMTFLGLLAAVAATFIMFVAGVALAVFPRHENAASPRI
jgi:hypothetical protein